jgi:hypothetical protein
VWVCECVVLGGVSLYRVDELIYGRHLFLGLHALRHLFQIAFNEIVNFLGYMHEDTYGDVIIASCV